MTCAGANAVLLGGGEPLTLRLLLRRSCACVMSKFKVLFETQKF